MKKIILLSLMMVAAAMLYSQQRPMAPSKNLINQAVQAIYYPPHDDPVNYGVKIPPEFEDPIRSIQEYQIGGTTYDLQTNYMVQNRVYYNPADGTIGAVWTMGFQPDAFADRGTGYNYFNGTSWQSEPNQRIETERTGWPNYAPWGPDGEIIISHMTEQEGLKIMTRPQKGTGEWTFSNLVGPTGAEDLSWPRMITSGPDHLTIHLLANTYDPYLGLNRAVLYYRSMDGGATWDIAGEILDGMTSQDYFGFAADEYGWAEAKGDTIAFVVASAWHDMFIMKSDDNGDNWVKTLIWENPYPMYDWNTTVTDTFFCVDNSASIAMDITGKVHVAFGINRVLHDTPGNNYWLFPYIDGIGYWNEDMPAFSNNRDALAPPQYEFENTELVENVNYVGWSQDMDGDGEVTFVAAPFYYDALGVSTMPSINVDEQGRIFIVYSSTTETFDNVDLNFKHIWARAYSQESGWTDFIDITADIIHIFDESIYPILAGYSDDNLHLIFHTDGIPGTAQNDEHDWVQNRIKYAKVSKYEFYPWHVPEYPGATEIFALDQNYPNPFSGPTTIRVKLFQAAPVQLVVTNLLGQAVQVYNKGYLNAGTYSFIISSEDLRPGIYYYQLKSGTNNITKKRIIQ